MDRTCCQCKKVKSNKDFYKNKQSKTGLAYNCKDCANNNIRMCYYKKHYNITIEEYNKMFIEQNGCCAICGKHQSEFKRVFAVDHNHITGKVRKLLCVRCNVMIGYSNENPDILILGAKYLNKYMTKGTS